MTFHPKLSNINNIHFQSITLSMHVWGKQKIEIETGIEKKRERVKIILSALEKK